MIVKLATLLPASKVPLNQRDFVPDSIEQQNARASLGVQNSFYQRPKSVTVQGITSQMHYVN